MAETKREYYEVLGVEKGATTGTPATRKRKKSSRKWEKPTKF